MEVYRWTPVAMIRITAWLAAGILTGIPQWCHPLYPFAGFLLSALLFFYHARKKHRLTSGIFGLVAVLMAGFHLGAAWNVSASEDHLVNHKKPFTHYLAEAEGPPVHIKSGFRIPLGITAIYDGTKWITSHSRIHLILKTVTPDVMHGEQLLIRGMPKRLSPPGNPNEFNYRRHLEQQGIFFRQVAKEADVIILSGPKKDLHWLTNTGRQACIRRINTFVDEPQTAGILLALLIGVTDSIDPEIITSYAATGTLHVLAVSGMHVGVIYWLVLQLLSPLRRLRNGDRIIAFSAILLLWIYAMITGLSPSVLRATVMCSFMALTKPFRLRTRIDNTLAASAFLLMLQDPLVITRAGFQLSFFAVAGILILNRRFHEKLEPGNILFAWIWSIICVSVSAQYLTLPITLYLFNQFPLLFLPANLIIIPLSFMAMGWGTLLLITGGIPGAGPVIAMTAEWTVSLMNAAASLIEHLPFSVLTDIRMSGIQAVLLMMLLVTVILLVNTKWKGWLLAAFGFAAGFTFIDSMTVMDTTRSSGFVVYREPGITPIDIRRGTYVLHLGRPDDRHSARNNLMKGSTILRTIDHRKYPMIRSLIGRDTLIFLNASPPENLPISCRWLVITGKAKGITLKKYRFRQLIIGSDVVLSEAKKMEEQCQSAGIPFHTTALSGAFIFEQPELSRLD